MATEVDMAPARSTARARFSPTYAFFGVVFIVTGLFGISGADSGDVAQWASVGVLAALGLAGIAAVVSAARTESGA